MKPGDSALGLLNNVLATGAEHVVLLMRHSAREFAPDRHDLLNPLTDEGRELSLAFGRALPKALVLKGYSSTAERCVETADLILKGHAETGGRITRSRPAEALSVFYIMDQMKLYKVMQAAGGLVPMLEEWFAGKVGPEVMLPPVHTAKYVAAFAASKLDESLGGPQLDVLVSHDMTLLTIRDQLLHQKAADLGDVHFLDAIAIYRDGDRTMIRTQHGDGIPLDLAL